MRWSLSATDSDMGVRACASRACGVCVSLSATDSDMGVRACGSRACGGRCRRLTRIWGVRACGSRACGGRCPSGARASPSPCAPPPPAASDKHKMRAREAIETTLIMFLWSRASSTPPSMSRTRELAPPRAFKLTRVCDSWKGEPCSGDGGVGARACRPRERRRCRGLADASVASLPTPSSWASRAAASPSPHAAALRAAMPPAVF